MTTDCRLEKVPPFVLPDQPMTNIDYYDFHFGYKTSQEMRMLSSVTINCQIPKIVKKFQIFGKFCENFQIFGRFSDFWETTTATKTILGLVTLETLITILTIENLNS